MDRVEVSRRTAGAVTPAIAALLAAATEALGYRPLDEDSWRDLAAGHQPGFAGFVARASERPEIVGYAQLDRGPSSWGLEYVLDPTIPEAFSVARALCRAGVDLAAREGGGPLQLWARSPTAANDEIAGSVGLVRERELCQMRRPLPIDEDASPRLSTRAFRVGQDEPAWLELNNRSFASHPEQGSWSPEMLAARERQPWFDPAGFLVHERGGKMVAFCWTKVHGGETPLGEIYVLGVDPAHQARGIGAAMLRAGLEVLHDRGLRTVMLYVDADNERAVELYRSFGFVVHHHDRAYGGQIEPAR
ncbi:MAG TPA: mycothiol synthase [Acidimicrobiales bacterium]|nr:mycothiol synthase [Acidimicrobiales bacterium]